MNEATLCEKRAERYRMKESLETSTLKLSYLLGMRHDHPELADAIRALLCCMAEVVCNAVDGKKVQPILLQQMDHCVREVKKYTKGTPK